MTDPKQDVRQQFEAWAVENGLCVDRYCSIDYYIDTDTERTWQGYQAALQSPAVRELVEESERVVSHLERAVEYIEKVYPNAKQLDRGPILSNMRRWSGKLRTALRTLGAGHVE